MIELMASAAIGIGAVVVLVRSIGRQLGWRSARITGFGVTVCGALVAIGVLDARRTIDQNPIDLTSVSYVRSETCASCHPDHVESWRRTYHRTMTQEPNATSVLGDFDDVALTFDNASASLSQDSDGFWMELSVQGTQPSKGLSPGRYRIDRVVGSHEMQVYLSRLDDGAFVTLPLEWNIRDGRWVSSAGNFLQPPEPGSVLEHSAPWNNGCAFCHNTHVNPGMKGIATIQVSAAARDRATSTAIGDNERFETTIEELGIACEACHGPGDTHARHNRNPIRRHLLHLNQSPDPTIVHPDRLAPPASVEVCGRCHGKWMPQNHALDRVLTDGDLHVPGQQPLSVHYEDPLRRAGRGEDVRGFLWPDATPQPTSMEYQGVILSKCYTDGGMTCSACHSMHDAPADDQLRFIDDPFTKTDESNEMCTQCHEPYKNAAAWSAHTHHDANSAGSRCVSCHMPFQTFGLMKAVRSHRITNPEPDKTEAFGLPNACTQCHVDQSLTWARSTLQAWYPDSGTTSDARPRNSEGHEEVSSTWKELQRGHALTRALAAYALGRGYSTESGQKRSPEPETWRIAALIDAMDDDYAAVRKMASDSLRTLTAREHGFDYLESPDVRADQLSRLRRDYGFDHFPPGGNAGVKAALRARRDQTPIVVRE